MTKPFSRVFILLPKCTLTTFTFQCNISSRAPVLFQNGQGGLDSAFSGATLARVGRYHPTIREENPLFWDGSTVAFSALIRVLAEGFRPRSARSRATIPANWFA